LKEILRENLFENPLKELKICWWLFGKF